MSHAQGPMIPRPAVTLIALALTAGLLVNVWRSGDAQANYLLSLLIGGVLGIDITRGWRGGRNDDDSDTGAAA